MGATETEWWMGEPTTGLHEIDGFRDRKRTQDLDQAQINAPSLAIELIFSAVACDFCASLLILVIFREVYTTDF